MTLFAPDIFWEILVYTNKAAVAAVAAIYLAMPAVGTAANADEDSAGALEDIVVTAQRRSESLQSVPISVTALDSSTIQSMGLTRLSDLAREVPGLNVVSSGPGQNILVMRGISSTAGTTGTVGFYLDDAPIQASRQRCPLSARGVVDSAHVDVDPVGE